VTDALTEFETTDAVRILGTVRFVTATR